MNLLPTASPNLVRHTLAATAAGCILLPLVGIAAGTAGWRIILLVVLVLSALGLVSLSFLHHRNRPTYGTLAGLWLAGYFMYGGLMAERVEPWSSRWLPLTAVLILASVVLLLARRRCRPT